MVFVTVGSQRFQFDRLLEAVDGLVERGVITEDVFAQTGWSTYEPQHYKHEKFIDRDEFARCIDACNTLITHGGTGVIVTAIKAGKRVVAVPRLAAFGEHVDDHQLQILEEFREAGHIQVASDAKELEQAYVAAQTEEVQEYESNTEMFIADLDAYLAGL